MQPHAQGPAHAVHQASVESVGQSRVKMFEQQQVGWPRWQLAATRGWPSSPAIAIASVAWAFAFALVASRSPWAFRQQPLLDPMLEGCPTEGGTLWLQALQRAARAAGGGRNAPNLARDLGRRMFRARDQLLGTLGMRAAGQLVLLQAHHHHHRQPKQVCTIPSAQLE